jgi:hypothetical protein
LTGAELGMGVSPEGLEEMAMEGAGDSMPTSTSSRSRKT